MDELKKRKCEDCGHFFDDKKVAKYKEWNGKIYVICESCLEKRICE